MGVDTVKLSYPLEQSAWGTRRFLDQAPDPDDGWVHGRNYGTSGVMWWTERIHADGTRVVIKGVGSEGHMLWEGSVPKFLGIAGAADPDHVRLIDDHLRRITHCKLPAPWIRRCDVTSDHLDPEGSLLDAAINWNPHARSRYVQGVYDNRTEGRQGRTVWQHNKTRGVRVYEKYPECGEEWARDLTRIEYQIRGDWLQKYGLDRLYTDFSRSADRALDPVVSDLLGRVPRG